MLVKNPIGLGISPDRLLSPKTSSCKSMKQSGIFPDNRLFDSQGRSKKPPIISHIGLLDPENILLDGFKNDVFAGKCGNSQIGAYGCGVS